MIVKFASSAAPSSGSIREIVGVLTTGTNAIETVVAGDELLTPSETVTVNAYVPLANCVGTYESPPRLA